MNLFHSGYATREGAGVITQVGVATLTAEDPKGAGAEITAPGGRAQAPDVTGIR